MAKLQRYSSQAPIAVNQPVYANPSAYQYTTAPAQAIGQIGQTVGKTIEVHAELQRQREVLSDSLASQKINGILRRSEIEIETMMQRTPIDKWEEESAKIREKAIGESYKIEMSDKSRELKDLHVNNWNLEQGAITTRNTVSAQVDAVKTTTMANLRMAYESGNQLEITAAEIEAQKVAAVAFPNSKIAEMAFGAERAKGIADFKKAKVNSLKPTIEASLANGMDSAIETIDLQINALEKGGVLSPVEAADARQDLTNWANDTANERIKQQESNELKEYEKFATDAVNGTLTADDLVLSKIPQKELEEIWKPIVKGFHEPVMPKATFDGVNNTMNNVVSYSTGEISKKAALINLMNDRYVNKTIDDETFKFAVGRIKEKYPLEFANTLKDAQLRVNKNLEQEGVGFFGYDWIDKEEKEKSKRTTMSLVSWAEDIKKETGKFPDAKSVYVKTRELGVSIDAPEIQTKPIIIRKPAPPRTDPNYVVTDEDAARIPVGGEFYSEFLNEWVVKVKE
jgi:hypothetical protein